MVTERIYKFNNGNGAVLCNKCNRIIAEGLGGDQPTSAARWVNDRTARELPNGATYCGKHAQKRAKRIFEPLKLDRFEKGQRVIVNYCGEFEAKRLDAPTPGTVVSFPSRWAGTRARCAWVALDERQTTPGIHLFGEDDPNDRGTWVLVYPEGCEEA